MLYICTKFHENIKKGFRVIERTRFLIIKFSKGNKSVKNIDGVMLLVLCLLSTLLYICFMKISQSVSGLFKGTTFSIFRIFKMV